MLRSSGLSVPAVPERVEHVQQDWDRWRELLGSATDERAAQPGRICELCIPMLAVTGAGISMLTPEGNGVVVCATDDVASAIEDLQFSLGVGPCVDAVQRGAPVLIPDLDDPRDVSVERWPAFMEAAARTGVQALFAFPLRVGAVTVGALDLYRDRPGELDAQQLGGALFAADAAALALVHLDTGLPVESPSTGYASYHLQVHQATGMVQVQLAVGAQEALVRLRARAFALGRTLEGLADDIVQRRIRFTAED
ncbi:MAG: hypothetical protein QOK42_2384 [Frankiaceae bacterium]|jgi:hypothetical protein|nr:hypothetical protein [Frankiaceae bacterium]MDX6274216.1 hypothetical protein [Frankiales bacterium]